MANAPLVLGLWSVVLEPGKTLSQRTTPAIQITNISYGPEVKGNARSAVVMKYPEFEQDSDDEDEEDDDEEEEVENEDGNAIKLPKLITKEACLAVLKPNGTEQVSINVNLVEDVEIVEFSVTGENPVHIVGHYIRQEDFDQEPYSDEEYGSDFDEDDSEFDDEEMSGLIAGSDEDEEMDDSRIEEILEEKPKASKKRAADAAADDSTISAADIAGLSKSQLKKLAKKQKGEKGEAVAAVAAPVEKAAPAAKKEEKKEAPKKAAASKTRTLAGGLEVTDAKEGTGAAAKNGSKVGMRYIGKLDNGKIFDQNIKGSPLVFNLGRGEVIKGWDLGVAGMKVGGERKLRIPAALAYGKQKLPGIPPNSVLNFEVKLGPKRYSAP
ncbi:hypothetical protein JCM6882_008040 [Rhodosporidiobolus microsporus]